MTTCTGDGSCLTQNYDLSYDEKENEICEFKCKGIRCSNYEFCKNINPEWLFNTNTCNTICKSCDINFGEVLEIIKLTEECSICYCDPTDGIKQKCGHKLCFKCFEKIYSSEEEEEEEGQVPTSINSQKCPLCRYQFKQEWLKNL